MKNYMLIIMTLFLLTIDAYTKSNSLLQKLDLENVFVIPSGYDTNDNVEISFLAKLPSACFKPAGSKLKKVSEFHYHLDFLIKLKDISACQESSDRSQVRNSIYYTKTISLGELAAGKYKITFNENRIHSESFSVAKAEVGSIDDFLYAPVSNVFISEMVYFTDDARVVLSGIIQSSCLSVFNRDISVSKMGNVFIVTPKARLVPDAICERVEVPLQKIISLGKIDVEGAYLIHVRSQSGLSVNKVFHMRKKYNSETGSAPE